MFIAFIQKKGWLKFGESIDYLNALWQDYKRSVTGRHDSGSYYTPEPIVSFMCREAIKGYLSSKASAAAGEISKFVDERDASELSDPELIFKALKEVTVCDPACGSGAYLLGMLHELLELRECLFTSKDLWSFILIIN